MATTPKSKAPAVVKPVFIPTVFAKKFYVIVSYCGKVSYFCEPSVMAQHEANFGVLKEGDAFVVWKDRYQFTESGSELTMPQVHVMVGAHLLLIDWKAKHPLAGPEDLKKAAVVAARIIQDAGIELAEEWSAAVAG